MRAIIWTLGFFFLYGFLGKYWNISSPNTEGIFEVYVIGVLYAITMDIANVISGK